jgi:hypothetical protein
MARQWPGNGPFRHLPPWERPGWLYGPGSCWTLAGVDRWSFPVSTLQGYDIEDLRVRKDQLEQQIRSLQQLLSSIEKRVKELSEQQ